MKRLYDGSKEHVSSSEGAQLTWVSDDEFDEQHANKVQCKFGLGVTRAQGVTRAHTRASLP